ncbi:substrate-binding domain-containing protein [Phytoactinopolyspora mesophila]|uniref:Substrate-binding domain-containing protein n=1 Tax=Phytoactinopolyspora mesophila TaxID=2650750 RepID=A0A7K3LXN3_9ACTN|nr:substrate-binding domain-containing protein [Phytoactinopolyspora mesophila]NDL55786.1 substrate-binding domain-containing protein [Phytoactinopolyspora mesophila]
MIRAGAVIIAAIVALGLAGCGLDDDGGAAATYRIAFLLPESKTARYESHDHPAFVERVHELCPECETLVSNAGQDAARQQAQAEAAITNGADVLVLDPVDSAAAAVIARHAETAGVPVISYDRLVLDAPVAFHVTFDNEQVGALQAQVLVDAVADRRDDGVLVVLNGSPTDDNAALFRSGASLVLDGSDVRIGVETDVLDWSPDKAQEAMERALATLGRDRVAGVYAANDGMAAGAIAAMKAAGIDPLPPVTGQDAELAAVRRVLTGEQHMTVYKAVRTQARVAAELSIGLAETGEIPAGVRSAWVDSGNGMVAALLLEPQAVTRETIGSTVVADGFWSIAEICGGLERECTEAGLIDSPAGYDVRVPAP